MKFTPTKLFSPYQPILPNPSNNQPFSSPLIPKPVHTTTSSLPIARNSNLPTNKNQPKTSIQKLSQSQVQAKWEKGLCFYCDEKYSFGHKCKATTHILIIPDSEDGCDEEFFVGETLLFDEHMDQREVATPYITLHAMARILMPQILKFTSCIGKTEVQILVDGGSTHNFLQSKVVSML